ncbi:MAG: IgA Peptidase M64 [Thermoanaerobaculia bacterium]
MKQALRITLTLLILASPLAADAFSDLFTDRTMRVDYFHSGDIDEEIISLDRIIADGPWPGSRTRLIDDQNLGKYLFEVVDRSTNRVIYSRGFASIYGEWETTGDARERHQTFHESLRFPWPKNPVQVVLKKRDAQNAFHEIWSTNIDPNSRFVNPAELKPAGKVWSVFENGPASQKVDVLIVGDGYAEKDIPKFHSDVKRLVDGLFSMDPFKSRKKDFNVRAVDVVSAQSGVTRPRAKQFRRTPVSAEYNAFDSERYVLTFDNRALRDILSSAPYEFIEILVNEQQYGGGGIFNFMATASVDSGFSDYVFIHEFGHHFAALADEYYTSDVAYETGAAEKPEPWEPNVTAMHDPAKLKWKDLVEPGTPLPTPWEKEVFEKHSYEAQKKRAELRAAGAPESEMDKLFREQQVFETKLLGSGPYADKVGAFEGAGYEAKGLYRPEADCIMFTRDEVGFCRVCSRAIERVIDQYSRP